MLRFYNVSIGELKTLPIYTFWEMHKNIDSIASEESLRMISCINTVMNPDANKIIKEMSSRAEGLVEVEHKEGFDRDGLDSLRSKMNRR